MLTALVTLSCSKNEDKKEEKATNPLIGTKWTTEDYIAELIYGKTCTTSIEFLDETRCQTINVRKTTYITSGTDVIEGVYQVKGDSVFWSDGRNDKTLNNRGKVSGSTITTQIKNMTYIKESK